MVVLYSQGAISILILPKELKDSHPTHIVRSPPSRLRTDPTSLLNLSNVLRTAKYFRHGLSESDLSVLAHSTTIPLVNHLEFVRLYPLENEEVEARLLGALEKERGGACEEGE